MAVTHRHRIRQRERDRDPVSEMARAQRAHLFAVLGTLLSASSLVFVLYGFFRLSQIIGEMNFTQKDDVSVIVDSISKTTSRLGEASIPLATGSLALLIGGCLVTYALQWGRFREPWFFKSTVALGLILLCLPPLGTIFGIVWLWCLFWYRSEFSALKAIPIPD